MQINTRIQNPTNYFFNQASKENDEYMDKIREFTKKLVNVEQCILCKNNYNFSANIPRILIHCGHTFCTSCLQNFHKNGRVRCPMCLKLVKQIDTIERLPVNHTIFTKLAEDYSRRNKESGIAEEIDAQAVLLQQFKASSMIGKNEGAHHAQQPQNQQANAQYEPGQLPQKMPVRIDEDSGLEWCQYHYERIKHFLCVEHKETCCRVCCELFHNKGDCNIIDLYEIEDMHGFLSSFFKKTNAANELPQNGNNYQPDLYNQGRDEEGEFEDVDDEDEEEEVDDDDDDNEDEDDYEER